MGLSTMLKESGGKDAPYSSRRILAVWYSVILGIAAVGLFVLAGVLNNVFPLYGGLACLGLGLIGTLVLLGYTTMADIKSIVATVVSKKQESPADPE